MFLHRMLIFLSQGEYIILYYLLQKPLLYHTIIIGFLHYFASTLQTNQPLTTLSAVVNDVGPAVLSMLLHIVVDSPCLTETFRFLSLWGPGVLSELGHCIMGGVHWAAPLAAENHDLILWLLGPTALLVHWSIVGHCRYLAASLSLGVAYLHLGMCWLRVMA